VPCYNRYTLLSEQLRNVYSKYSIYRTGMLGFRLPIFGPASIEMLELSDQKNANSRIYKWPEAVFAHFAPRRAARKSKLS
jgi:hypothetical protein